ncbi:hypothetical protein WMY93_031313 [Mugilogobius chulae]|uniref:Rho-GAP domain-containing protein n=1 Tax=Mugilogobius chulae TaxID=88201 RepID=A0AAW0MDM4_9GOBI
MTECFLPPSSSPAEQRRAEHPGGVARTPSSEEISPTKFPGLYRTGEPSPPHDGHHHEPPDAYVSDDDKEHNKKKNKFKKKEKRTEGYAAFQEDSSADEAESPSKMKRSKASTCSRNPASPRKRRRTLSVKRTALYDGIQLPAVFRECVDYIENYGMKCEGIYRVSAQSGVRSRGVPCLEEYDPHTVASLLKQYLRELPENLLGRDMSQRFEDACGRPLEAEKVSEIQRLLSEVCPQGRLLLSWLVTHMDHVIARETDTKMNIQNISIVLNPTIQIGNRVLYLFFTHVRELFGDVELRPVVRPLRWSNVATMPVLPETQESIKEEIRRQDCETKIAQEIASLSKEDVSKEEMTENEEEVINLLLKQENEILTEQEELISLEQVLRRQIATEKEEIERLRAEIADIQSRQQGRSETEEYSSDSESESEDEEELQMILEDLQKQNEELENKNTHLNQAIHEEQEAILELRVQLRLLQNHKQQQQQQQQELTVQPSTEQAPPAQPSPEARPEEQTKRPSVNSAPAAAAPASAAAATAVSAVANAADANTSANGKQAKDPPKPSPSKDKETPTCEIILLREKNVALLSLSWKRG